LVKSTKRIIFVAASVAIAVLVLGTGSFVQFNPKNESNQSHNAALTQHLTNVIPVTSTSDAKTIQFKPVSTVVMPVTSMINPKTEQFNPVSTIVKPVSAGSKFITSLIKSAFATSDPPTLSDTEWDVSSAGLGGSIHSATVDSSGNNVYIGCINCISQLNFATNTLTSWVAPSSDLTGGVAVDSSGNVFFTANDNDLISNKIGKLVPSTNTFTEWAIPTTRNHPVAIAIDSSGNVYFNEVNSNKIGRLVPSTNTFTEWALPTINAFDGTFYGIIFDSSNNVYFAENNVRPPKIGKLVPSTNTFTEWTVPTGTFSFLRTITFDSSGNVFFTANDEIGKLVPSTNTFTEWGLITGDPQGIVVDSSGNVFFADHSGSKIRMLTPSAALTTLTDFPLPTGTGGPDQMMMDSSGKIYFTAAGSSGHIIGRIG
jgi:streptogramin lyase